MLGTSASSSLSVSAAPSWKEHVLDEVPVAAEDAGDAVTCLLHTILFTRAPGPVRPSEATCAAFPNITYALCAVGDVSRKVEQAVRGFEEAVALGGSSYVMGGSSMAPYGQVGSSMGGVRGGNSGFVVVSFFERKVKKALFGLMSNEEKTVFEKWILPLTVTSSPSASQGEKEEHGERWRRGIDEAFGACRGEGVVCGRDGGGAAERAAAYSHGSAEHRAHPHRHVRL
jgi:autophagy-related protein 101